MQRRLAEEVTPYEPCAMRYMDYSPCEDPNRAKRFIKANLAHRERHCPKSSEQLNCLIPPPVGYKRPLPWPQSRDEAWYVNVPHKQLTTAKADQNWIRYDEQTEKFSFPGGGTMFHKGADHYLEELGKLIPLTDGSIRTALDTGCGVGSFGAYLLSRGVLTMSLAPRDGHEAQVQFALERGLPAMIGVLATKRLPYPARSFDMAHCSRCLIPWWNEDGRLLAEIDRVLRPGGFWVLTGPPIDWQHYARGWNRTKEDLSAEQDRLEAVGEKMCWRKYKQAGMFAIWQKPLDGACQKSRGDASPPMCPADQDADLSWYTPMETCLTPVPAADSNGVAGGSVDKWPARLTATPPQEEAQESAEEVAEGAEEEQGGSGDDKEEGGEEEKEGVSEEESTEGEEESKGASEEESKEGGEEESKETSEEEADEERAERAQEESGGGAAVAIREESSEEEEGSDGKAEEEGEETSEESSGGTAEGGEEADSEEGGDAGGEDVQRRRLQGASESGVVVEDLTVEDFAADSDKWRQRVRWYKRALLPDLGQEKGQYRNIMDMSAGMGGFAAALGHDPVWVMNVVPVDRGDAVGGDAEGVEAPAHVSFGAANTLGVIYDRGLLGTYQDWCEAFSTYPRTYDLVHADELFSQWTSRPCPVEQVLLEVDRILRPEGVVLIRDDIATLRRIKRIAPALRWDARIERPGKEDSVGKDGDEEVVLVCTKKYWTSGAYELLSILVFACVFPALRFILDRFVFEKVGRRYILSRGDWSQGNGTATALEKSEKQALLKTHIKFKESCWKCMYYISAEIFSVLITLGEPWMEDTRHFWVGPGDQKWPDQMMKLKLKALFNYVGGFYTYSVFALIFWETRRKDFGVSMTHHVTCVILVITAYVFRFGRVCSLMVAIHDASDIFLELAKLSKYIEFETSATINFLIFAASWAWLRLWWYPRYIIYSSSYQVVQLLDKMDHVDHGPKTYYFFNFILVLLLVLHVYWWILIAKVIIRQFGSGEVEDGRSDDDEDDD
ncbi:unnamed protein product [Closterium sp. Yama58-4]|nr:unnamed protein product [Closterium sp. Yama58-4]